MKKIHKNDIRICRSGCKDIWNAFMANNASFTIHDIPFCHTTATEIPKAIITWEEAKSIYKKRITKENDFFYNAFVCFYIDDYKFDGPNGIWQEPNRTLSILRHFSGVITPDFSTYQDFPAPIKIFATYRMRLIGYWFGCNGLSVINNVRWGTSESYTYCFDGIPKNSMVCVSTVGGSPRKLVNRDRFEKGLEKMVETLKPHTIIVYGSINYNCFELLKTQGIKVVAFPSQMSTAFERRKVHEQK